MKKIILFVFAVAFLLTVNAQAQRYITTSVSKHQNSVKNSKECCLECKNLELKCILDQALANAEDIIVDRDGKVKEILTSVEELVPDQNNMEDVEKIRVIFQDLNDILKNNPNPKIQEYTISTKSRNFVNSLLAYKSPLHEEAVDEFLIYITNQILVKDFLELNLKSGVHVFETENVNVNTDYKIDNRKNEIEISELSVFIKESLDKKLKKSIKVSRYI